MRIWAWHVYSMYVHVRAQCRSLSSGVYLFGSHGSRRYLASSWTMEEAGMFFVED